MPKIESLQIQLSVENTAEKDLKNLETALKRLNQNSPSFSANINTQALEKVMKKVSTDIRGLTKSLTTGLTDGSSGVIGRYQPKISQITGQQPALVPSAQQVPNLNLFKYLETGIRKILNPINRKTGVIPGERVEPIGRALSQSKGDPQLSSKMLGEFNTVVRKTILEFTAIQQQTRLAALKTGELQAKEYERMGSQSRSILRTIFTTTSVFTRLVKKLLEFESALNKIIQKIRANTKLNVDRSAISKLVGNLRTLAPVSPARIKLSAPAEVPSNKQNSDSGRAMLEQIALGVRKGQTKPQNEMANALTKAIKDQLPQPLAKTGPLVGLRKWGFNIWKELSLGLKLGQGHLYKTIDASLKQVGKYFPHSPAEVGALTGLRTWGQGIIGQLTLGISDKIASFLSIFTNLAAQTEAVIQPMVNMQFLSERSGVDLGKMNALLFAFAGFEVQATDIQMSLSGINRSLLEISSPEKLSALAEIGVNMDTVRAAADPTLELFFQMSDAMKQLPLDSPNIIKALDAVGMASHTNLVNAMKLGREEIQKLMEDGVKLGAVYTEEATNLGVEYNSIMEKFKNLLTYLEREFTTTFLPVLKNLFEKVLAFYEQNSVKIRSIVTVAGQAFGILIETVGALVEEGLKNPEGAKKAIFGLIFWISDVIREMWAALMADLVEGTIGFFGKSILAFAAGLFTSLLNMVWAIIQAIHEKIQWGIVNGVLSSVEKLAKLDFLKPLLQMAGLSTALESMIGYTASLKAAEEAAMKHEKDFMSFIWTAADENAKIMKEATDEAKELFKTASDPAVVESTVKRFSEKWSDLSSRFVGAFQGTGFDKILSESAKRLDAALSSGNIEKAKEEIINVNAELTKMASSGNEGIKKVSGAIEEAGSKAEKAIDKVSKIAAKEASTIRNKIALILTDSALRGATGADAARLQKEKELLELKDKHKTEQEELLTHLSAINKITVSKARQTAEFQKLLDNQAAEQRRVSNKEQELEEGEFFSKKQKIILDSWTASMGSLSSAFENMYSLMGEKAKNFFYIAKAVAIGQATITAATATLEAYAKGNAIGGPPVGAIFASIAAAFGATQIATIVGQMIKGPTGMNKGGIVPGSGDSDTVPAMLTPGEVVIPKPAVQKYGLNLLEAIRSQTLNPDIEGLRNSSTKPLVNTSQRFAIGGIVAAPQQQNQQQPITIANFTDPREMEKFLASRRGQDTVLNILQSNSDRLQRLIRR